jgi:hypothetical protein
MRVPGYCNRTLVSDAGLDFDRWIKTARPVADASTMEPRTLRNEPVVWAVAALACFVGAVGVVSDDALWLVSLGDHLAHGRVPHSIPYATASTAGWHNVPVGAELIFWSLFHGFNGIRGLAVAQAAACTIGFGALARGLRREATAGATLLISALVLIGSLSAVAAIGVSLFSLALFPVLLGLLESESNSPSRRLWLSIPLLALWGNLHGEVLAGWGLLTCYLVLDRARRQPGLSAGVFAAATAALFANPELWDTPRYYLGVLHNEVAKRASGFWTPLGTRPLDLVLIVVAAILVGVTLTGRVRLRLWEGVALVGIAAATVHTARTGTWFLFLAAYPAARSLRRHVGAPKPRLLAVAAAGLGAVAATALIRGPADPGSYSLARMAAVSGRPVLATSMLGEQVALAGGHVWVDEPIDAFRQADQVLYLDWAFGKPSGGAAVSHAAYVLVAPKSPPAKLAARDPRLVRVAATGGAVLYRVRAADSYSATVFSPRVSQ